MEREERERKTAELEFLISIWKDSQLKRIDDEGYFHYTQSQIDRLEDRMDKVSRLENSNEYL